MSLSVILENVTKPRKIEYVMTSSVHKVYARKVLNEILESNPAYGNIILLLSQYYALLWSSGKHPKLDERESCYDKEKERLFANEMLEIVRAAKDSLCSSEKQCIEAVHFGASDVSRYIMASHYKDAVLNLCIRCYGNISKTFSSYIDCFSHMKEDELLVCHDLETLLVLQKTSFDKQISDILIECANKISEINDKTDEVGKITGLILSGASEIEVAAMYGKSRTYIRNKTRDGLLLISILLWGFATKMTLRWLLKGEN